MSGFLLSSIIKQFESEFVAQYATRLSPTHHKALAAMKVCRTHNSKRMQAGCIDCDHQASFPHSCGHRSCPHCQYHEGQQWLERQLKKQVPAGYFLITFTLPAEFRSLARHHQKILYSQMIQCSWDTIDTFSNNDKQLKGTPGAISVLHTHSRRLDFHPHVHMLIPAAAINKKQRLWRTKSKSKKSSKPGYLFNHTALAAVFRGKLLGAIKNAKLTLPKTHPEKWVVDCKAVGSGDKALIYLGRYLYRGVIREKDILAINNGNVTFGYKNSTTKQVETRTEPGAKFLWLILQHILPKGFRRARNFGFLHPNSKRLIQVIQLRFKIDINRSLKYLKKRPQWCCPCCGSKMIVLETRLPPLFRFGLSAIKSAPT